MLVYSGLLNAYLQWIIVIIGLGTGFDGYRNKALIVADRAGDLHSKASAILQLVWAALGETLPDPETKEAWNFQNNAH